MSYSYSLVQVGFVSDLGFCCSTTLSVGDVVLNIGNPNMKGIDAGTRAIMALWEAASVRSSGFTTISPAQVAPAAQ